MTEEHLITLIAWAWAATLVLIGYSIRRLVKTNGRRWRKDWQAFRGRGYRSKTAERITSWAIVHAQQLQLSGCRLGILLTIMCVFLPLLGSFTVFPSFKTPYSLEMQIEYLRAQVVGPAFLLALWMRLELASIHRKRVPWVLGVLGLIGAYFTADTSGYVAHDFSHALFFQCSGVYKTVVSWICAGIAAGCILVCWADAIRRNITSHDC